MIFLSKFQDYQLYYIIAANLLSLYITGLKEKFNPRDKDENLSKADPLKDINCIVSTRYSDSIDTHKVKIASQPNSSN